MKKTIEEIEAKFEQLKITLRQCSLEHTIDAKETDAMHGVSWLAWMLGVDCPEYREKRKGK